MRETERRKRENRTLLFESPVIDAFTYPILLNIVLIEFLSFPEHL